MGAKDPRVDAYIAKAGGFAKPILTYLREIVHKGCPDVVETMKWSSPFFMHNGILCNMAAFKQHCTFGFWRGREVLEKRSEAMGQFGRITSLKDLPSEKALICYVKKAALLSESGVKLEKSPQRKPRVELATPPELKNALKKNKKAEETFKNFNPSHRREYIDWITEAKREETRAKRVEQTVEWLAEGKRRHWKYQNC
jgi:uncharacterized protein YdeI (YjbR/CyaY-like superfamily)